MLRLGVFIIFISAVSGIGFILHQALLMYPKHDEAACYLVAAALILACLVTALIVILLLKDDE